MNPQVTAIYSIKAVKMESGRPAFYNVGKVTHYSDGTVKMRMNHIPDQEYRLFKNDDRRGGKEEQ